MCCMSCRCEMSEAALPVKSRHQGGLDSLELTCTAECTCAAVKGQSKALSLKAGSRHQAALGLAVLLLECVRVGSQPRLVVGIHTAAETGYIGAIGRAAVGRRRLPAVNHSSEPPRAASSATVKLVGVGTTMGL